MGLISLKSFWGLRARGADSAPFAMKIDFVIFHWKLHSNVILMLVVITFSLAVCPSALRAFSMRRIKLGSKGTK